ncbi:MAG: hypothetical protein IT167_29105 [Bryobacterales bacterium]|nr:hypothetical protein [Bryobacterales bacterium]
MSATNHNGSRGDVLLLLDSPNYIESLNSALAGTGTVISAGDVHRPMGVTDDREYELPEFSREYLDGRFEYREIAEPAWWIVKRNARVRTPNFDLISTATICGKPGVLLVEAKAHHGELETCGKSFKSSSSLENHQKIGASIELAHRALNGIAPGFKLSRDGFYQVSNRMAWGWRLASLGVRVTVLYLGFVQDPYWPKDQFESNEDWMQAARSYLGNIVPVDVLDRRIQCSERGSLLISAAALPAPPPQ